jgi:Concanavalin A-like lectin/glucanases superfamily
MVGPARTEAAMHGAADFLAKAVAFDGVADHLLRGASLAGSAEGPEIFFSCWINPYTVPGAANQVIYGAASARIHLRINTDSQLGLETRTSAAVVIGNRTSGATLVTAGVWQHWCGSYNHTTGVSWMRKNAVSVTLGGAEITSAAIIDWVEPNHGIGGTTTATLFYGGLMAEVWIDDQFIADTDANVLKFISSLSGTGAPVDLGPTGELPGFGRPIIYLSRRNGIGGFVSNKGTGGGFTDQAAVTEGGFVGAGSSVTNLGALVTNDGFPVSTLT